MADTTQSGSQTSRRTFLKVGAGVVGGLVVGGAAVYLAKPSTPGGTTTVTSTVPGAPGGTTTVTSTVPGAPGGTTTVTSTVQPSTVTSTSTSTDTSEVSALQKELVAYSGNADALITLGVDEAAVVSALAATIIPTDSNGPGAKEAGVIYFIDRQLWGEYGTNGRMYRSGPFVMPNSQGPVTVNTTSGTPVTYPGGTPPYAWTTSYEYQYGMNLRDFWRYGIDALETYANSAYGGNYETLSAANQTACLADLFNNKPSAASFNYIIPSDFANEVFFMTWSGFLMDPMYGGNRGMVGWTLTASPGLNNGNFYGEGQTPKQRMVSPIPLLLAPASNAQFQQSLKVAGVLSP